MDVMGKTLDNIIRACVNTVVKETYSITMEDIDDLLDEVIEYLNSDDKPTKKGSGSKDGPLTSEGKCIMPYIGSKTSHTKHKPCSALRCIKCDFGVVQLPSARWRPGTDYVFLRTNMPHAWSLARQLEHCAGAIAYGCQCSHFTALKLQPIQDIPSLQWVCGGHDNKEN